MTAAVVPPAADLAVRERAKPSATQQGREVIFIVTVSNHGPLTATAVQLADRGTSGLRIVSLRARGHSCTRKRCKLGTLGTGRTLKVTVVALGTGRGRQRNTVTVSGAVPDPRLGNNRSVAGVRVIVPVAPRFAG